MEPSQTMMEIGNQCLPGWETRFVYRSEGWECSTYTYMSRPFQWSARFHIGTTTSTWGFAGIQLSLFPLFSEWNRTRSRRSFIYFQDSKRKKTIHLALQVCKRTGEKSGAAKRARNWSETQECTKKKEREIWSLFMAQFFSSLSLKLLCSYASPKCHVSCEELFLCGSGLKVREEQDWHPR